MDDNVVEDPLLGDVHVGAASSGRRHVSLRGCLLCVLSIAVFGCIVGAIVLPVVLLLQNSPSLAPSALACAAAAPRLLAAATAADAHWPLARLRNVTDRFGARPSASPVHDALTLWLVDAWRAGGLAHVRRSNVTVRHWQPPHTQTLRLAGRGTRPARTLGVLALGNSVNASLAAEVVVVRSAGELRARAAGVRGRAVLFNNAFTTYGESVRYRSGGPELVARLGGVAVLVRSVTPFSLYSPHTGATHYGALNASELIPAVAVTVEDAELMQRLQDAGEVPRIELELLGDTNRDANGELGLALSHNVMAELTGSELPNEVVVLGGHTDSWNVGQGALDDGTGFVAAWSAVQLLHDLGFKPKRTVRVVGWTNEENGGAGAKAYADSRPKDEKTIFAFESDHGTNAVAGVNVYAPPERLEFIREVAQLLEFITTSRVENASSPGATGVDIAPLVEQGVPGAGLITDVERSKYFYYHHTNADTFDKVNEKDLQRAVATLAVYALCLADEPSSALPNNTNVR